MDPCSHEVQMRCEGLAGINPAGWGSLKLRAVVIVDSVGLIASSSCGGGNASAAAKLGCAQGRVEPRRRSIRLGFTKNGPDAEQWWPDGAIRGVVEGHLRVSNGAPPALSATGRGPDVAVLGCRSSQLDGRQSRGKSALLPEAEEMQCVGLRMAMDVYVK
ncbi:hypothetical protein K490DRAFT_55154 [Saccharata proteae CBS 121410]|uniref:Uncharacterized protein n=1 Tax=Saccharata proteae CBS 121410 TaxID=1314787 RepID=A0A6A5YFI8_9PEZI|nr:hypothetical protein K490DRAFT_55154 [Saccharata proteae CBS 121410]